MIASKLMPRIQLHLYPENPAWVLDYVRPDKGTRTKHTLGEAKHLSELQACMEAQRILEALKAGCDPFAGDRTVAEYHDQYRMSYARQNLKSWRDIQGVFNRYLRRRIGRLKMIKVTARDLQRLVEELRSDEAPSQRCGKLADGTIYQVIAELKALFNSAWKAGHITTNPAGSLKQIKLRNHRREVYSDEELRAIFQQMQAGPPKPRLLFVLLLATAARIGELLNAKHADVNEAARSLFIGENKSGRPIVLPLSDEAMAAYAELKTLAVPGNPYLFPASRGMGPMSPPRKALAKVLSAVGLTNRTFHDCRRTAITEAVQTPGVTLLDASRLANHSSVRITEDRYVVTGDARLRTAATAIGKQLNLGLGLGTSRRRASALASLYPTTRCISVGSDVRVIYARRIA